MKESLTLYKNQFNKKGDKLEFGEGYYLYCTPATALMCQP